MKSALWAFAFFILSMSAISATLTLVDGGEYKGDVVDGMLEGKGQIHWPDGSFYIGEFASGLIQGKGELLYADKSTYAGTFEKGQPQGEGVYTSPQGERYVGTFKLGQFINGELQSDDGTLYQGDFQFFQLHGEGKVTFANGAYWKGNFQHGYLNGKGSFIDPDGDSYFGEFQDGYYHGTGELAQADGTYLKGRFEYGVFQGEQPLVEQRPEDEVAQSVERALYGQSERLQSVIDAVPQGDPNKIELYFIGIAGDGSQRVFEREVLFAQTLMQEKFKSQSRSVVLVNSEEASDEFALATTTSIERTLDQVSKKMNADQDILFVYLTSHGSPEFDFYLNHNGIQLGDLSAENLAMRLNELPIKHKIVGISACYSGGFIPLIQDDHTLVFSSARNDRTSFGCSDDNDFTYFGRAFFNEALANTHSIRYAFHQAYDLVTGWEKDEGFDPSEPQISAPSGIVEYWDQWIAQLNGVDESLPDQALLAKWWMREKIQTVSP